MGRRLRGFWRGGRGAKGGGPVHSRRAVISLPMLLLYFMLMTAAVLLWLRIPPQLASGMGQIAVAAQHGVDWVIAPVSISAEFDKERAVRLFTSSLPRYWSSEHPRVAAGSWTQAVREWVYRLTGYDFSEPSSFLKAELRGYAGLAEQMGGGVRSVAGEGSLAAGGAPAAITVTPQPGSGTIGAPNPPGPQSPGPQLPRTPHLPDTTPEVPEITPQPPENRPEPPENGPLPPDTDDEPSREPDLGPEEPSGPASVEELLARVPWGSQPLIAVLHTHASEMYRTDTFAPENGYEYHLFGTDQTGIVRVGERLVQTLTDTYGIPAVHSKVLHDTPCHSCAYVESRKSVEALLRQYPSLKFIIDVHRDGAEEVSMLAALGGEEVAQVALVVGRPTNLGRHPKWQENDGIAQRVATIMRERYPGMFRRTLYLNGVYNQDLHPRAMLVEIGNYYDHETYALRTAELFAGVLAEALYEELFGARPPVSLGQTDPGDPLL